MTVSQTNGHQDSPDSGSGSTSGGGGSGGGSAPTCWAEVGLSADVVQGPMQFSATPRETILYPIDHTGKTQWQVMHCLYPDGHWVNEVTRIAVDPTTAAAPAPPPALTPAQLALRATARLHLEFPPLHVSPPGAHIVVGFPTWIWVDAAPWRPVTVTDTDAGLSVTLTATPVRLTFDPGDGTTPTSCDGPGTPYREGHDDPWAISPTCGHTYTSADAEHPGGRTSTTTTIIWQFTWHGSDGSAGTLPDLRLVHHENLVVRSFTAITD